MKGPWSVCFDGVAKLQKSLTVGTHYCLAVGNDEGLELDKADKDEKLGKGDEE